MPARLWNRKACLILNSETVKNLLPLSDFAVSLRAGMSAVNNSSSCVACAFTVSGAGAISQQHGHSQLWYFFKGWKWNINYCNSMLNIDKLVERCCPVPVLFNKWNQLSYNSDEKRSGCITSSTRLNSVCTTLIDFTLILWTDSCLRKLQLFSMNYWFITNSDMCMSHVRNISAEVLWVFPASSLIRVEFLSETMRWCYVPKLGLHYR